jgi:hypothetical protein
LNCTHPKLSSFKVGGGENKQEGNKIKNTRALIKHSQKFIINLSCKTKFLAPTKKQFLFL